MQSIHSASAQVLVLRDGRSIALRELLGSGSIATVHRGIVESGWGVKRPAAVKILSLSRARAHTASTEIDPAKAMKRLGHIARAAACVRHPAVIDVFEVDRIDAMSEDALSPFIVSELVEGESLASIVSGWRASGMRVPLDFALVVTLRAAEALGACLFTEGADGALTSLVHGDLSPRQILVSSHGEVKVGDFGLDVFREYVAHDRPLSQLAYMAPEVACGAAPTAESDVFSLGVMLQELLVGPRFAAETSAADAMRMVRDGQRHRRLIAANLPPSVSDIIEKATAKSPFCRYPHARAMAFDLRREMLQLGLLDAQTCVRQAIVGWCEVEPGPRKRSQSGIMFRARRRDDDEHADQEPDRADAAPSSDTQPSMPFPLRAAQDR